MVLVVTVLCRDSGGSQGVEAGPKSFMMASEYGIISKRDVLYV